MGTDELRQAIGQDMEIDATIDRKALLEILSLFLDTMDDVCRDMGRSPRLIKISWQSEGENGY